jgi:protein-L-isoaspartate(D-aspartate) O-methyltransferase
MTTESIDAGMSGQQGADMASAMRDAMVSSQLRPNAVTDARLIAAMATIAREDYLPPEARAVAYRDSAIPLGHGRFANPALATARLIGAAALVRDDRVLLIGAGGGYTAAILAAMGVAVVAVEENAALMALARGALAGTNVTLVEAPLGEGAPDHAPFDVLMIDGAVEIVPPALIGQVRAEGRIVAGLVERGVTRLALGRRSSSGYGLVPFVDSECVILPGFAKPRGFEF